jgi:hypothetical protein
MAPRKKKAKPTKAGGVASGAQDGTGAAIPGTLGGAIWPVGGLGCAPLAPTWVGAGVTPGGAPGSEPVRVRGQLAKHLAEADELVDAPGDLVNDDGELINNLLLGVLTKKTPEEQTKHKSDLQRFRRGAYLDSDQEGKAPRALAVLRELPWHLIACSQKGANCSISFSRAAI